MKKEKKTSRSKTLPHRRHKSGKTGKSRRTPQTKFRAKHTKHHRSKSPATSSEKIQVKKHSEDLKPTPEECVDSVQVCNMEVKTEVSRINPVEEDCNSFMHLINNREKLIHDVLEVVREDGLKKITPDALKICSAEQLKAMCFEELNRMSAAEIKHILSGRDPSSFNPTTCDIVGNNVMLGQESSSQMETIPSVGVESPLPIECVKMKVSPSSTRITAGDEGPCDDSAITSSLAADSKSETESDSLELCATQNEIDSLIQEEIMNQTGVEQPNKGDLTDMEILELELRARIIRSLLKSQGVEMSDDDEVLQQKENVRIMSHKK